MSGSRLCKFCGGSRELYKPCCIGCKDKQKELLKKYNPKEFYMNKGKAIKEKDVLKIIRDLYILGEISRDDYNLIEQTIKGEKGE